MNWRNRRDSEPRGPDHPNLFYMFEILVWVEEIWPSEPILYGGDMRGIVWFSLRLFFCFLWLKLSSSPVLIISNLSRMDQRIWSDSQLRGLPTRDDSTWWRCKWRRITDQFSKHWRVWMVELWEVINWLGCFHREPRAMFRIHFLLQHSQYIS